MLTRASIIPQARPQASTHHYRLVRYSISTVWLRFNPTKFFTSAYGDEKYEEHISDGGFWYGVTHFFTPPSKLSPT